MTKTEYHPDSVTQLIAALLKACGEDEILSRLEPGETREFVEALAKEQFAENRTRAQKSLRETLNKIAIRLDEEDRLAD